MLMKKVKIHPLILLGLFFSSISIGMFAYRNFANQEIGVGIMLLLIVVFLISLIIIGLIRNRKMEHEK